MLSEKLEALRAFAITARTAIYNEDAMTAIELAGVTACKVNQCVEAINSIIDILEDLNIDVDGSGSGGASVTYDANGEVIKF